MSLLMDALKKAEASKRQADDLGVTTSTPSVPTTESPAEAPRDPRQEIAQHSNAIESKPVPEPALAQAPRRVAAASATSRREAAERQAASQVFSAKQPERPPRSNWALIFGLSVVAALGIGAYFWWQLQPAAPRLQAPIAARPAAPVTPEAATPTLPSAPTPAQAAAPVAENTLPGREPAQAAAATMRETPGRAAPLVKPQQPARPTALTDNTPLQLSKTQPATLPQLEKAWDTLQAGRLEEAQHAYAQVLHKAPHNTDALLGLANIALRQGNSGQAEEYYLRVLEADPDDATAQAGLIGLRGQSDPGLSESRLKTLLSRQPESAPLHFVLGNLYARQQRWSEAQQAYFKAFSCDADNPDYLFNLAVSLDHLRQPRLAAQYYQQALDAAGNARSLSFDQQQVTKRLSELQ